MAAGSSESSQPVKSLRVPIGHIVVSDRWRKTELAAELQKSVQVQFEDSLGVVDFHPASHVGVIYVSEADVIGTNSYKRKCAKLRMGNRVRGIVLVECTPASEQYYEKVQTVCGLEMGLTVIPITSADHAASLLVQMVVAEGKSDSNPFKTWPDPPNEDDCILTTLQTVPGLGSTKAKHLLERFKSLHGICLASQQDLAEVVGPACAQDVWKFFNGPIR